MAIRCKFKLDSIERSLSTASELATLKMSPVYDSNPESENGRFWRWTPSGKFEVGTVNGEAVKDMVLGAEYYIDITPAK